MKTIYIFIIFIVVGLVQLFVPANMILNQETILKSGTVYKFKTRPVDPNDPFKGKYINLNYQIDTFETLDTLWQRHDEVYVYLTVDSLGFAKIKNISRDVILNSKNDYIKAKVYWYSKVDHKLSMSFPFNRYYMEESKADNAEKVVRDIQRKSATNTTYALVYIKNGQGVLNDVILDGIPIKDYLEKHK